MLKKTIVILEILAVITVQNLTVFASSTKYPDYSYTFIGEDKWENFNRKMFNFNLKLNKYAVRPIHILWSSIMPEYGMDRIQSATNNIEYPIRVVSSLLQRDFKAAKNETVRFLTNTTLGLGGLFDPAKHLFKLEQAQENMEQALASCKIKTGPYLVLPFIPFISMRGVFGSILDIALNPGSYIATPIFAMVKAGLTINKTSYIQPLIKMVESNYADPYDIARKAYGIERFIKHENFDRIQLSKLLAQQNFDDDTKISQKTKMAPLPVVKTSVSSEIVVPDFIKGKAYFNSISTENFKLNPDIILENYNPQNPVVDSMRTALFDIPEVNKSIWNDISIWNRSFSNRLKTGSINIAKNRENYKYHYILNKDKNSPVAIIYPSIGEGINSSHSVLWAKLFYDAGYSVIIQGSHFAWEFVKSMPEGYHPGLPAYDAEQLRNLSANILADLKQKYKYSFDKKVIFGTSFGGVEALFVADKEYQNNTLGTVKYISICPPVELLYAMGQVDKISQNIDHSTDNFKEKTAMTAAKVLKIYNAKDEKPNIQINSLPFSEEEGKLITGFIMHQKLSDIIYTIEANDDTKKDTLYNQINNMDYKDYAQKYLLSSDKKNTDDLSYETSLYSISDFLINNDNYKIYHSINDYLTNTAQLKQLKDYAKDKIVLLDNGAHLGFTYREEFLKDLKQTIASLY
ncbi:VacJ family lipoprotein [bacterium]|nr:VacJ family lipoprotein [bacterium]